MAKYLVLIGADTLGIKAKSKKNVKRQLDRAMDKMMVGKGSKKAGHLNWKFKGRIYTWTELNEAHVLTLCEYFEECTL